MTTPRVAAAMAEVDRDRYVLRPDGTVVPQSSASRTISAMLELADVHRGTRMLEVGTGSGYSTALLATLVGSEGSVTSVDVDHEIVERARVLLREDGRTNVAVVQGDGRDGWLPNAPYDRILAWGSSPEIPAAWLAQLCPDGAVVAPLSGRGIVKAVMDSDGRPVIESVIEGAFIPLTATPLKPWETSN